MATVETTKADGLACSECGHERSQHFEMRWPEDPNHCLVEGCDCDYFCWQKKEVAPDPGLREAIADGVRRGLNNQYERNAHSCDREYVNTIADAVLSVLAERGVP